METPLSFQPRLVRKKETGGQLLDGKVLPVPKPDDAVQGGGVGLAGPYLAGIPELPYNLSHKREKEPVFF